ncbi:MAG: ABC transporter substrate-binding protein [Anaerolineaceae bacterium]|nr:ABC transporter substrate-binding protein [Anaerolineaceae bacterium]
MKLKSLNLLVVLAMFLTACATATQAPAAVAPTAAAMQPTTSSAATGQVIKVGALYSMTGPDAGWAGEAYIKSHQMAIDEINAAGGIKCLGGAKLQLAVGDTQSTAEKANSEMQRLISQEKVVAVFGSAISGATLPASQIANQQKIPYIVPNALDATISDQGLYYVFQTVSLLQNWAADDAKWVKAEGAKTAVITVPNITFGSDTADAWKKGVTDQGMTLLDNLTYDSNAQDLTDTVLKVKSENPDVWFLLTNSQGALLMKEAKEQGFYPKMGIVTLGSGFSGSTFLSQAGASLADGIIVTSDFAPVSSLNVSADFEKAFKTYTGQDLGGTYNTTYASTWLLADALEKSCSTDPTKLADTLHNTTFQGGKWNFMWPSVSFDSKGRLTQAASVIAQWQNGQQVAVAPDNFAAAKAVWPVPGWDQRTGPLTGAPLTATGAQPTTAAPAAAPTTAPAAANDPALASDYSKALLADAATAVDTSKYKKAGPYVIATSNQDPSNGWGNTYNVTLKAYGDQLLKQGILKSALLTSATNDANQQISDVENFIGEKPDAIVIEPDGKAALTATLKSAVDAGIPVVLCANGIDGPDFTTRVDVDFYQVAYESGLGLAKLMGGKGNIVIFNGIAGVDSTETWQKAALDALSNYPDIKVVATEYAQWNIATAKQKMEAVMAAHPQIDGIWAGGGEMALGAALAYQDANKPAPKFAMVNVPNGFLRLADQYKYQFVGSPDPPSMSKYCLQTAVDILQGKPVNKFISLRTLMDGADPYTQADTLKWYVPTLNDDFIPPATVDTQSYIDGGFARK